MFISNNSNFKTCCLLETELGYEIFLFWTLFPLICTQTVLILCYMQGLHVSRKHHRAQTEVKQRWYSNIQKSSGLKRSKLGFTRVHFQIDLPSVSCEETVIMKPVWLSNDHPCVFCFVLREMPICFLEGSGRTHHLNLNRAVHVCLCPGAKTLYNRNNLILAFYWNVAYLPDKTVCSFASSPARL